LAPQFQEPFPGIDADAEAYAYYSDYYQLSYSVQLPSTFLTVLNSNCFAEFRGKIKMKDLLPPIDGYPKLACHMGMHPELAIFRRFGDLNAQNLLYLQAELVHLEKKLRAIETADCEAQIGHSSSYARDWYWLNNSAFEENNNQILIIQEIRNKLKEYSQFLHQTGSGLYLTNVHPDDALIQQAATTRLSQPSRHDLRSLQDWLERPKMGNFALIGSDRHVWNSDDGPSNGSPDLVVLRPHEQEDHFSEWVVESFLTWFHYFIWHRVKQPYDPESGLVSYEQSHLLRCTSFITTVIATLLPILSIVVLYYVQSMEARLGIIAAFTVIISLCLRGLTTAKMSDIFIATAT